jgi:hypothetical protein
VGVLVHAEAVPLAVLPHAVVALLREQTCGPPKQERHVSYAIPCHLNAMKRKEGETRRLEGGTERDTYGWQGQQLWGNRSMLQSLLTRVDDELPLAVLDVVLELPVVDVPVAVVEGPYPRQARFSQLSETHHPWHAGLRQLLSVCLL